MKIKLLFFFLAVASIGLVSCGGDDDVDCTGTVNLSVELSAEIDAVTNAGIAYGTNPTTENCEDYVNALEDYLDALSAWESCANEAGVLDEFQQDLADAQAAIDDIEC